MNCRTSAKQRRDGTIGRGYVRMEIEPAACRSIAMVSVDRAGRTAL
jgi:hypothetical protein